MTLQLERSIQREVLLRLKVEGWQCIALPHPNGVWIPAHNEQEKRLIARLINRMKADGLLVTGAGDLSVHWCDGSALVEIKRPESRDLFGRKRPAGTLTPEQAEIRDRATELGVRFVVVRSWEELRRCLEEWGVRRST